MNLAGRAGRWSAENWKKAVFGWLAFAVGAMVLGNVVGHVQMADSQAASGEAARALTMLERANFKRPASESVLIQARNDTLRNPVFLSAVSSVVQTLQQQKDVTNLRNPLVDPTRGGAVSRDGHSVLVQFDIKGDPDKAKDKVKPIMDAVAGTQTAFPSLRIEEVGTASATYVLDKSFTKDFATAERMTLPITLLILLAAFGSLVAACLPVVLAFSAVLASLGLYALVTNAYSGDYQTTSSVILLIGMAVGVDYSLFYIRREREERAGGREPRPALQRAASTSGQAVLISGLTVLVAMAGMLIAGNKIFTSIALGTMLVVLCAIVGSLTVLPAALAKLGDRVDRGRVPYIGRKKQAAGDSRFWGFVLSRVLRRPGLSVAVAGSLLLLAASPVLSMHTKLPSFTDMRSDLPIVKTYERVIAAFPGAPTPAEVVIRADDVHSPAVVAGIERLESAAVASGVMYRPIIVTTSPDHTVSNVAIPLAGNGDNPTSLAALKTLRQTVLPATLGNLDGVQYAVTGETAGTKDFNDLMKQRMGFVIAFVLALAFVLLLATFRSIVIPITAICLNLLSVGAAYGLLVLIFQHTWAEGLLGFTSNGAIVSWLPMFLFVVLFGLSMDYHVFILSRIKELHDNGATTDDAVSRGIRRTAGTVTSAAIIMVAVFAIFGTLHMVQMKELGVGLALAILIDATVIRGVMLPATMKLLGDWNWYLPHWLDWVPSLTPDESPRRPPGRDKHLGIA